MGLYDMNVTDKERLVEEGKQARAAQQRAREENAYHSGNRMAYDKGRSDAEASLAKMLYEQVYKPQGSDAYVSPQEAPVDPREVEYMQRLQQLQDQTGQANFREAPSAQELEYIKQMEGLAGRGR